MKYIFTLLPFLLNVQLTEIIGKTKVTETIKVGKHIESTPPDPGTIQWNSEVSDLEDYGA